MCSDYNTYIKSRLGINFNFTVKLTFKLCSPYEIDWVYNFKGK